MRILKKIFFFNFLSDEKRKGYLVSLATLIGIVTVPLTLFPFVIENIRGVFGSVEILSVSQASGLIALNNNTNDDIIVEEAIFFRIHPSHEREVVGTQDLLFDKVEKHSVFSVKFKEREVCRNGPELKDKTWESKFEDLIKYEKVIFSKNNPQFKTIENTFQSKLEDYMFEAEIDVKYIKDNKEEVETTSGVGFLHKKVCSA